MRTIIANVFLNLLASSSKKSASLNPFLRASLLGLLIALAMGVSGSFTFADTKSGVEKGDKAPDFTLNAQDGKSVALKDFLGRKNVVLYFYPKDNTAICTKEACSFRDAYTAFTDAGAEVLGVSSDTETSHEDFAVKNELPFKLLTDSDGAVRKLYGVPKTLKLMPGRVTYVIDKSGIVRLTFNSQTNAKKHVTEALKILKDLNNS